MTSSNNTPQGLSDDWSGLTNRRFWFGIGFHHKTGLSANNLLSAVQIGSELFAELSQNMFQLFL
jgi:hypothetical protein